MKYNFILFLPGYLKAQLLYLSNKLPDGLVLFTRASFLKPSPQNPRTTSNNSQHHIP